MDPTNPSSAPPPPEPPRLSGKIVVAVFVVFLVVAVIVASRMRYQNRQTVNRAHVAMLTMRARINLLCTDPSLPQPADLRERGRCTDAGSLDLSVTDAAPEVQQVSWVLIGPDKALTGQLKPAEARTIPLTGVTPGPHLFDFVVTNKPMDLQRLAKAVDEAPAGDVPARLIAAEKVANQLRDEGFEVRTERLNFRVEDSKVIH